MRSSSNYGGYGSYSNQQYGSSRYSSGQSGGSYGAAATETYRVGQSIEFRTVGTARWQLGTVRRVNDRTQRVTYDIENDRGREERDVPHDMIRAIASAIATAVAVPAFDENDRVEARYKGKGTKWYRGRISRVHRDGICDIRYLYDDGDCQ